MKEGGVVRGEMMTVGPPDCGPTEGVDCRPTFFNTIDPPNCRPTFFTTVDPPFFEVGFWRGGGILKLKT